MIKLHGAYTAMVTLLNSEGYVDFEGIRKNVVF
jgi:dihydrodipicolinate synthase/N-acetylneuraminate lyase